GASPFDVRFVSGRVGPDGGGVFFGDTPQRGRPFGPVEVEAGEGGADAVDVPEVNGRLWFDAAQADGRGGAAGDLVDLDAPVLQVEPAQHDPFRVAVHAAPPQEKPMSWTSTSRIESEPIREARSLTAERRLGQP